MLHLADTRRKMGANFSWAFRFPKAEDVMVTGLRGCRIAALEKVCPPLLGVVMNIALNSVKACNENALLIANDYHQCHLSIVSLCVCCGDDHTVLDLATVLPGRSG